jgi:hypothetical protein
VLASSRPMNTPNRKSAPNAARPFVLLLISFSPLYRFMVISFPTSSFKRFYNFDKPKMNLKIPKS